MKLHSINLSTTGKGVHKNHLIDFIISKEHLKPDFLYWGGGFLIQCLGFYFMYQKQSELRY